MAWEVRPSRAEPSRAEVRGAVAGMARRAVGPAAGRIGRWEPHCVEKLFQAFFGCDFAFAFNPSAIAVFKCFGYAKQRKQPRSHCAPPRGYNRPPISYGLSLFFASLDQPPRRQPDQNSQQGTGAVGRMAWGHVVQNKHTIFVILNISIWGHTMFALLWFASVQA